MFHWAHLESVLNAGIHKLLRLEGVEALIATANITVRDKISLFRTLITYYNANSDWLKAANKTLDRVSDLSGERNLVAHNMFSPHEDGGVEFFLVKAKGKFALPETVWSIEDFVLKHSEMTELAKEIERLGDRTDSARRLLKAFVANEKRRTAINALAPPPSSDTPRLGLLDLLDHLPQPDPNSDQATPGKAPRKRKARQPKAE